MKSFSIGAKIYSIAIALIVLMIAVSVASIYMVNQVRDELELQSTVFLPLNNRIASIETTVLEGEVLIERLRHALEEGRTDSPAAQVHDEVRRVGQGVDAEFQRAYGILNAINMDELGKDSAVAATRVEASLRGVESEYRTYQSGLEKFLQAHTDGQMAETRLLEELLTEEEEDIYHHLEILRAEMQQHVNRAVTNIIELENVLNWLILVLTGTAAGLGLLFSAIVTRWIVMPMRSLVAGLKRVGEGDLETTLAITSQDETGTMALGFNEMIAGLRAKERITETFGKYVDSRVVDSLIGNPAMTKPGGDRRYMTVLFADMRGFTSLSERLSPDALVNLLNAYLTDMSEPIQKSDGVIDKFIGDAIMAYWGPPFVDPLHQAQNACIAALTQLLLIEDFRKKIPDILGVKMEADLIDIHSGIASGPALVGTVGSAHHRNYTIMGDTVNLAARIEGACKTYGVRLLVDEATRKDTDGILFREIDAMRVKGRTEPVSVYEAMAFEPAPEIAKKLARGFEHGLSAYRRLDLDEARRAFEACLTLVPGDGPSETFLARLDQLVLSPPPADWDGVFEMHSK